METLLTAIKPTGVPHLGNYAGAIRPALEIIRHTRSRALLFVADGHALNSVTDPAVLARHSFEVAAFYLAAGLDPDTAVFFRQSDVPEIFELAMLLGCVCSKGLLNRSHAYKAAVATNRAAGRDPDAGINMGLFGYPLLMAADILAFDTTVVPVGADQKQHVEIARTLARKVNQVFGAGTVVVPELVLEPAAAEVPGIDGRKMSKSYDNGIPAVASTEALRKAIFRFVTDARPMGTPAQPDEVPLFSLVRAFATSDQLSQISEMLRSGRGYGEIKQAVFEVIDQQVAPVRENYLELTQTPSIVIDALEGGALVARRLAEQVLDRVKHATGMRIRATRPIAI
jgi:tryptophanyl-tRNA synthetase